MILDIQLFRMSHGLTFKDPFLLNNTLHTLIQNVAMHPGI